MHCCLCVFVFWGPTEQRARIIPSLPILYPRLPGFLIRKIWMDRVVVVALAEYLGEVVTVCGTTPCSQNVIIRIELKLQGAYCAREVLIKL